MIHFIRFTNTNNQTIYLDIDSVVMVSELRYRENDIGYVGSTITYRVASAASSINVKDDPETVYHLIRKGDLVHEQEIALALSQPREPYKEQETRPKPELKALDHVVYEVNGQVYQILAVLNDDCYRIQGRNHSMSNPDEHVVHASKLTKCQPYRVRPEPTTYRHPPQETPPCNGNGEAQSKEG